MTTSDSHLIFSPHLDDAVFSIGGFIARNPSTVRVATFFAGKPDPSVFAWWDKLCGFKNGDQAITARLVEDTNAFAALGVMPSQLLYGSYFDIQYRQALHTYSDEEKLQLASALARDMVAYIQEYRPTAVYAPLMQLHPDHAIVHHAAILAREQLQGQSPQWYWYQDLPYSYSWFLKRRLLGRSRTIANTEPVSIPLEPSLFEQKMAGIQAYKTQFIGLGCLLRGIVRAMGRYASRGTGAPYGETLYRITTDSEKAAA